MKRFELGMKFVPPRNDDCRCVAFKPIPHRHAVTLLVRLFKEVGRDVFGYGLRLGSSHKSGTARPREL
jgi:hypothetical protein